ncbi:phage major tail tube protein [Siccibacter colletis]|uniref:phage major tail tube protein n=1 Tax=Siccibacter colletis TaxID=1505757 RepID=UPI0004E1F585|nr:phage major tail tube protein [Siccibacter colletis]
MALPRKLKYMNLFLDGTSYLGVVTAVTLPKLTRKLENYRGGGMNGVAPVDLGLDDEALSTEWTLGGFPDEAIWSLYGAVSADAVPVRFAGSYQRDDTGEIVPVEVVMRGRLKEIDAGEAKPGEDTEAKIAAVCTYYKLTINGKTLVEIDTVNMVEIINGVDRLAQHRRNIGL